MESVLRFRHVLTPQGMLHDHALVVDSSGKILRLEPATGPWQGYLALPGMPNAHSHAFQRVMSGVGESRRGDDTFWSWRQAMYRAANSIDPEQLYVIARWAFIEMLRAGFTRVAEFHYLHHVSENARTPELANAVIAAATDAGIGLRLLPVFYQRGGFTQPPAKEQFRFLHRDVESFLSYLETLEPCELGIAPHSLRAVPPELVGDLVAGATALAETECPIHIHIAEQTLEVEQCMEIYGKRPIELLTETVELSSRWSLVHATHATTGELQRVAEAGANVVLCPLTEAYLGDGLFDATRFSEIGGSLAIGSDSNCRISVLEEIRMLEFGQRLKNQQRAQLADETGLGACAWQMLARGGAAATGFDCGSIEPGKLADLVVLGESAHERRGLTGNLLLDALVINGDNTDIDSVYVAGRKRVEDGTHFDANEAQAQFRQVVSELFPGDQ